MNEHAARTAVAKAGLKFRLDPESPPVLGRVIRQWPAAGAQVARGAQVIVRFGWAWQFLAAVAAVLLLLLAAAVVWIKRPPFPLRIELVPHADPDPRIEVGPPDRHPDVALNLEPHERSPTQTIEELRG